MENICDMPTCSQQSDIQQIKSDVQAIKTALLGNEFNNNMGYIKRQNELEQQVRAIKTKMIFFAGGSSVGGFIVGFLLKKFF